MSFTLANVIREHAASRPGKEALVYGDRRFTYAEVHERSSRAASALRAAGVQPGDRVGLLMKNCSEFYELMVACSKAGAIVVGLNWRLAPPELAAILDEAQPKVIVADEDGAALLGDREVVLTGAAYEAWLAEPEDPHADGGPDDGFLLLFSSGTTGLPKGVMITNEDFSFIPETARELYRMTPESAYLVASPLFHIGGAGTGMTAMTLGGRTVILQGAAPADILATIERERITHAFFVPAVIQALVESPDVESRDLSSFEIMIYGAAPMTDSLLRRSLEALGCGFVGCYGMTETTGTVSGLHPDEHRPDAEILRSVGRPLPWIELKVADLLTGAELPPREVGEIWVRAEQNMKGYWHQPDATAKTLVEDGWVRTGDGAYRDEAGYIYLQDRIKDMIISGGENIYPAEIENVLADHPAVAHVAVIGVPHERWGETPKAVVVARPGIEVSASELIDFARSRLARYKCPTSVEFIDEMPRNASGKVLKKDLRARFVYQDVAPPSTTSSVPTQ